MRKKYRSKLEELERRNSYLEKCLLTLGNELNDKIGPLSKRISSMETLLSAIVDELYEEDGKGALGRHFSFESALDEVTRDTGSEEEIRRRLFFKGYEEGRKSKGEDGR